MKECEKTRILHVFGRMDRGGAETWIVSVLREINSERYDFDFLVQPGADGAYDDEIRQLGGRVIKGPSITDRLSYPARLLRIMRTEGPYDVVHSHVHHFSGVILPVARLAGIPTRIAHSHNDLRSVGSSRSFTRQLYEWLMKRSISAFATDKLAVSEESAISLFGRNSKGDHRGEVLHCGINLEPFGSPMALDQVRAEFGIPANAFVIGHVGSFSRQKNHQFLVKVFSELLRDRPDALLLMMGDGPLKPEVEEQVRALGIDQNIRFGGVRADIPRVMRGSMDCLLMPSLHEGIPLVLMEAQAAGLQCIVSDTISNEALVVPSLFKRMSLSQSEAQWAEAVLSVERRDFDALAQMRASSFNVINSVEALRRIYSRSGE